jgi:hypothetical protein
MGWNVQLLEPEPSSRLDRFTRQHGIKRVDMLKIDAGGRDFEVLRSHDFAALPPRLAMVEFSTGFAQQSLETVDEAIAEMGRDGYEALVFSYEPHGNFNGQAMERELIAADFAAPVPRGDGDAGGNIVFFGQGDTLFLATVLRLFLSFLPPRERQAYV